MQHEFVACECMAERVFEQASLFGIRMQRGFEFAVGPAAFVLCAVQREIGVAQQFLHRPAIARADRRSDAGADVERVVFDLVGFGQALDDFARQRVDPAAVARFAQDYGEFIAA